MNRLTRAGVIAVFLAGVAAPVWLEAGGAPKAPGRLVSEYEQGAAAQAAGDFARARQIWMPLALRGEAPAQYSLGRLYEKGLGTDRNYDEALRWYRRAAEQNHADAQYRVAVAYAFGAGGVSKDETQAAKWLQRAAENGHVKSQKMLARAYQTGELGIRPDAKKAEYWNARAQGRKR